jgi:hypothetical protein
MHQSWTNFTTALNDLKELKISSTKKIPNWVALRRNLTDLFGVQMAPLQATPYDGGKSRDPDKGFEGEAMIKAKLIKAGTGRNIELGQKSVMAYVDGNMVKPHDNFSGERDEDSIHELFDRLEEIHRAPVEQVSYKIKVDAVFKCLKGRARQDVIGFKGAATRREYLELWRGLFRQYGVTANDVARQLRLVNGAAPKSMDLRDMMAYMNVERVEQRISYPSNDWDSQKIRSQALYGTPSKHAFQITWPNTAEGKSDGSTRIMAATLLHGTA